MCTGDIIRSRRQEKNMTQKQIAQYLGISAPAVNKWEQSRSMPETSLLLPLSELLGVSVDILLKGEFTETSGAYTIEPALFSAMAEDAVISVAYDVETGMEYLPVRKKLPEKMAPIATFRDFRAEFHARILKEDFMNLIDEQGFILAPPQFYAEGHKMQIFCRMHLSEDGDPDSGDDGSYSYYRCNYLYVTDPRSSHRIFYMICFRDTGHSSGSLPGGGGRDLSETDPGERTGVSLMRGIRETESKRRVLIRTFGQFDVFVNGQPVLFHSTKARELLALLVDRRGAYLSSREAAEILWKDDPSADRILLARYRKVAMRMKDTLEEYRISDIIENVNGKRRICPEKISCDLYDYLSGNRTSREAVSGRYLPHYTWSKWSPHFAS